jgi:hypothetical protein
MAMESVLYALTFGMVASALTALMLPGLSLVRFGDGPQVTTVAQWTLPTQLMISLGAGIYEELLFRVILVSGLAWLGVVSFRLRAMQAKLFAVCAGALIFSAFHYVGQFGEPLRLNSFVFRMVAGLMFSGLYVLRGFGITAWTHALYDIFLAV